MPHWRQNFSPSSICLPQLGHQLDIPTINSPQKFMLFNVATSINQIKVARFFADEPRVSPARDSAAARLKISTRDRYQPIALDDSTDVVVRFALCSKIRADQIGLI